MQQNNYIYEELTIAEFSDRFLNNNNFSTPMIYDVSNDEIEILGKDPKTRKDVYNPILKFIIKPEIQEHYTDKKIKCAKNHIIL